MAASKRRGGKQASLSRAQKLHRKAILIDGEGVSVLLPVATLPVPSHGRPILDRLIEAGVTAMNVTMGIGGIAMGVDNFRSMVGTIHGYLCYFELEKGRLLHIQKAKDILRAKREGKVGIIFGVQGLPPKVDDDVNLLRILHKLGLRIAQLTYNERNSLGCGCQEPSDTGLTQIGRVYFREMNDLGILIDLSHAGERTTLDSIDASSQPIVVSHANVRALCESPRNVTDDVLRALAARGGVIGITAYSPFCETTPGVRPTVNDYIDHVAYVADLVGIDHVGIGSDFFDGESAVRFEKFFKVRYPDIVRNYTLETIYADGFNTPAHFPRLTEGLVKRGFADADILKILGANFYRVFEEVW